MCRSLFTLFFLNQCHARRICPIRLVWKYEEANRNLHKFQKLSIFGRLKRTVKNGKSPFCLAHIYTQTVYMRTINYIIIISKTSKTVSKHWPIITWRSVTKSSTSMPASRYWESRSHNAFPIYAKQLLHNWNKTTISFVEEWQQFPPFWQKKYFFSRHHNKIVSFLSQICLRNFNDKRWRRRNFTCFFLTSLILVCFHICSSKNLRTKQ